MTRGKYPYGAVSKIDQLIKEKSVLKDVPIKNIIADAADFCEVSPQLMKDIKNGKCTPSLPIGIKISEYFEMSVNEIWGLKKRDISVFKEKKNTSEIKICKDDNCKNKIVARGYCSKHYQFYRNNNKLPVKQHQESHEICTVEGCDGTHHAKGLCKSHYFEKAYDKRTARRS